MVDTMKSIPRFRTYLDIVNTVVTGYYPLNYLELGPYFTIYSFNPVEGHQFRMGARTSSLFSKTLEFEAYGAYGTRGPGVQVQLRRPWFHFQGTAHDPGCLFQTRH